VRCRIVIACLSSLSLFLKLWKCYAKLPRLSVCVSVFRISGKRADRFPWNFSGFIGVIRKRERKKIRKMSPWCLKILKTVQNCRFREGHAVEKRHGATALAARATCAACWRHVRWRHGRGPCRQRAGEFYESNVYELIVNCATGCFLRGGGVTGLRPGKPLAFNKSQRFFSSFLLDCTVCI